MNNIIASTALIFIALAGIMPLSARSDTIVYKVVIRLYVPRVYDNMYSLGYRKVQCQTIKGYLYADMDHASGSIYGTREPEITVYDMVNKTHKVSGKNVTYGDAIATDVMWRYIGSNKSGVFKKAQIKFSLDLNPSYNIGDDEPDNTLVITLAGRGSSYKSIRGHVTGQIGCGCMAYGHVSPTRTIDMLVNDITPLYGNFTMRRIGALCYR